MVMITMVALMDDGVHGTQDCVNVYTSGKKQNKVSSQNSWGIGIIFFVQLCVFSFFPLLIMFFSQWDIKSLSQLIMTMWEITKLVFVQCVCGNDFTAVPVKCSNMVFYSEITKNKIQYLLSDQNQTSANADT